ncbi:SHOCT domain-containing protein [Haloarcula nitratireducens]|uniref:SHOCT domain-containing protein n=1 Tax=Haloarcula nitratireducens TaxID=2487749 RepID=A0AAW4PD39_9EURY|nr:SHOCT domain-containing protein [Halomicroarcula nitratireducens]MBX0295892.1 SHOCT domain-containing protein [Halomicroarcula nitratireducens]
MTTAGPLHRASENATEIVSTLVTGIWLAALFTGQDWWLGFMLFGYVVLVPLTALLFGDRNEMEEWWDDRWGESADTTPERDTETDDALSTLRERYARGELTDEQFERKLENLLETDTLEDLEDRERELLSERE